MVTIIAGMAIGWCVGWLMVNGICSTMVKSKNNLNKRREPRDAETDAFIQQIENKIRNYKIA